MALIIFWLLCGLVAAVIGSQRECAGSAFLVGCLLGPLGILCVIFSDSRPKCPFCAERHSTGAKICPHCRTSLVRGYDRPFGADTWENQVVDHTRRSQPSAPAAPVDESAFDGLVDEALGKRVLPTPPPPPRRARLR